MRALVKDGYESFAGEIISVELKRAQFAHCRDHHGFLLVTGIALLVPLFVRSKVIETGRTFTRRAAWLIKVVPSSIRAVIHEQLLCLDPSLHLGSHVDIVAVEYVERLQVKAVVEDCLKPLVAETVVGELQGT